MLRHNALLWTLQILLACLFVFAGGFKLVAAPEAMQPSTLPVAFLRFIGVFLGSLSGSVGKTGDTRAMSAPSTMQLGGPCTLPFSTPPMAGAVKAMVAGIDADCGGACSCAT